VRCAAGHRRAPAAPPRLLSTYFTGVRARDLSSRPLHLTATDLTFAQLQRICRMRLGWHALARITCRFTRLPKGQRVCKLCAKAGHVNAFGQPVEDVAHHLVECPCLQHVRARYPQLFMPDMLSAPDAFTLARYVFCYRDQQVLAQALQDLYSARATLLAAQPPPQSPPPQPQQVLQCGAAASSQQVLLIWF
jgi:hypothetical protein